VRKESALILVCFCLFCGLLPALASAQAADPVAQSRGAGAASGGPDMDLLAWALGVLNASTARGSAGGSEEDGTAPGIRRLWALYLLSVEDGDFLDDAGALADSLLAQPSGSPQPENIVEALAGALDVVRAKHARWPPTKLKHVNRGMDVLGALVSEHPRTSGIRYLRLVSGYHLPFFLKQEDAVQADFEALYGLLPEGAGDLPRPVLSAAAAFVLAHGNPDPEARAQLEQVVDPVGSAIPGGDDTKTKGATGAHGTGPSGTVSPIGDAR
jgi:hypothetical protein